MKALKIIISLVVLGGVIGGIGYLAINMDQKAFESVCDKNNKRYTETYCQFVGYDAWSKQSVLNLNDTNYGQILGVAWRRKGSIISSRNQSQKRYSEGNSYYYIIGNPKDASSQFLRIVTETDPRPSAKK